MHIRCTENEQFLHQNKHQNKPFLWLCFHLRQSDKKGTPNNQRWNSPVRKAYHITFFRFNILQPGERWREREKCVWERNREMKCSELPWVSFMSLCKMRSLPKSSNCILWVLVWKQKTLWDIKSAARLCCYSTVMPILLRTDSELLSY